MSYEAQHKSFWAFLPFCRRLDEWGFLWKPICPSTLLQAGLKQWSCRLPLFVVHKTLGLAQVAVLINCPQHRSVTVVRSDANFWSRTGRPISVSVQFCSRWTKLRHQSGFLNKCLMKISGLLCDSLGQGSNHCSASPIQRRAAEVRVSESFIWSEQTRHNVTWRVTHGTQST